MTYRSIISALEGVHFPINKNDLMDQVGDREVSVTMDKNLKMSELLDACDMNNFNSAGDVDRCKGIVDKIESTQQEKAA